MVVVLGRSSSHYTRVVRMLAHELDVPYALDPIHDLLSEDPATFGGNPALKLPAVRIGGEVTWGSQNACRAIARLASGGEARVHWPEDARAPLAMNAHEVVAHAMAAQVEVVFHEFVARRPPDAASRKRRASLLGCLAWLDANLPAIRAHFPADRLPLFDLMLFSLLEHLPFRNPVDLSGHAALLAFADHVRRRPSAIATPYAFDPPPA